MSDVTDASAQLRALAQNLPFHGVAAFDAALDGVAQQAAGIVAGTGKEQVVDAIHATRSELTQSLHGQVQQLAASSDSAATSILG